MYEGTDNRYRKVLYRLWLACACQVLATGWGPGSWRLGHLFKLFPQYVQSSTRQTLVRHEASTAPVRLVLGCSMVSLRKFVNAGGRWRVWLCNQLEHPIRRFQAISFILDTYTIELLYTAAVNRSIELIRARVVR